MSFHPDPLIGTWRLNPTQSKVPADLPGAPVSQTEVYREVVPGQIEMVLSRVLRDGGTVHLTLVWPMAGGLVRVRDGARPPGESLVETRLGPGDWLLTYLMDGEQYGTMRKTLSLDRHTMRQTFTGTLDGRLMEVTFVVERQ